MKSKGRELAMAEPYSRANAAAWAWYMHGEKGKSSVSEIWFSSKSPVYRPSRFRQEAMKQSSAQIVALKHGSDRYDMMNLGLDFGSSLFDSYEIVALSDQLDKSLYGFLEEHAASSKKKDHAVHKPSSEDLLSSSYLKDDNVKNSSKLLVQSKDCDGPIEDYSYRIKRHRRGRFSKAFQSWLGLKSCTSFSSRVDCADLDIEDDHVYRHSHEHHHYHHHHHHHYQDCHIDASKHDHLMLEFGSPQVLEVILHHALQSK